MRGSHRSSTDQRWISITNSQQWRKRFQVLTSMCTFLHSSKETVNCKQEWPLIKLLSELKKMTPRGFTDLSGSNSHPRPNSPFLCIQKIDICFSKPTINSWWLIDAMWPYVFVNIASCNGMIPDDAKPLPEPMSTSNQNANTFYQDEATENVVCKMWANLFTP